MQLRLLFALSVPLAFASTVGTVRPPVYPNAFAKVFLKVPVTNPAPLTLRLAKLFSDGMVMQRNAEIPIIGWSAPNATVSVAFDNVSKSVKANAAGEWRAV